VKYLIATAMRPKSLKHCNKVFDIMRNVAAEHACIITKALWCEGPGCSNLAFEIIGDEVECEEFGFSLNHYMQPAKWSETTDKIASGFNCTLKFPG